MVRVVKELTPNPEPPLCRPRLPTAHKRERLLPGRGFKVQTKVPAIIDAVKRRRFNGKKSKGI